MSHKLILWIVGLLILILALSGRIIRAEGAPLPNTAQTSVALTLQAIFTPQNTATAPPSLIIVTPSATPTSLPLDTATPTYSVPILTVREATNCRTGPGQAYQILVTYQVNQTLEIVGRYDLGNFWLVKSAESPTGTCWLWGEYVEATGSYWIVSSVTPPPTATQPPPPPQAPSLQNYEYFCNDINSTLSFSLIWNDIADTESGYRIFRDGWQVIDLSAGSTTYEEIISMPVSRSAEYYVQAYNETGSANSSFVKLTCD